MYPAFLTVSIACAAFASIFAILYGTNKVKLQIGKRFKSLSPIKNQALAVAGIAAEKKKRENAAERQIFNVLEKEISSSGILIKPREFLMLWIFSAFAPPLLLLAVSHSLVASLAGLVVGVILPPFALHSRKSKRTELFEKQLIEALSVICNCLRSGLTFQQAMISISGEMPDPISKEFSRVIRETDMGLSIEKALSNMADRMNSQNFMLIVSAIQIQRQIGGNLSDILSSIAGTIKERFKIKSEIRVLTATGRMSGMVIGLLPVFIILFFMLVNPSYIEGFVSTTAGIAMMIAAVVLETLGFMFIKKIVNIKY